MIWGGDLYTHEIALKDWRWKKNEFFRRFVIKRLGYLITYVPGDVALARLWYGAKGKYHECLMYTSNIYRELVIPPKTGSKVSILVGNSGDPTNNHLKIFSNLLAYKNENITIYCPLSYGGISGSYAKQVAAKGAALFGDKFVALTEFMPFSEYLEFLGQIDIAIFAHQRQQGMGNTITLLGLGKKVYMRSDVNQWLFFKNLGINIFDFNKFDLATFDQVQEQTNTLLIKKYFSKEILVDQLRKVFS